MCWERSHKKRTMATTRCNDNQTLNNRTRTTYLTTTRNQNSKQAKTHTATGTQTTRWKPLGLDKLLQERMHRPPAIRSMICPHSSHHFGPLLGEVCSKPLSLSRRGTRSRRLTWLRRFGRFDRRAGLLGVGRFVAGTAIEVCRSQRLERR